MTAVHPVVETTFLFPGLELDQRIHKIRKMPAAVYVHFFIQIVKIIVH
jgi:hypothetical protein